METNSRPVVCSACHRQNLPGGVRCVYCGTQYPPNLDFVLDLPDPGATTPSPSAAPAPPANGMAQQGRAAGAVGTLTLLALKAKAILTFLKLGKVALTLGSMLVSVWFYARFFKWPYAVGLVICILIHEMGHVFVNWRKGIPATAPMFLPFFGAVIFVKGFPDDPTSESESGAGGPFAGMLAALVCLAVALTTQNPLWMALAHTGFLINLFNLIPVSPLDGSRISAAFSPRIWNGVLLFMLLWALKVESKTIWFVLLICLVMRFGSAGSTEQRYLLAEPKARLRMGLLYLALTLVLTIGADRTFVEPDVYRQGVITSGRSQSAVSPMNAPSTPTVASNGEPSIGDAKGQSVSASVSGKRKSTIYMIVYLVAGAVVSLGLWLLTQFLLVRAASARFTWRALGLVGTLTALLPALLIITFVVHNRDAFYQSLEGYIAALLAGLVYAAFLTYHNSKKRQYPTVTSARAHCLGWAAVGALLVAYTTNSLFLLAVMLVLSGLYFVLNRWVWFSLGATVWESMGDYRRTLHWLQLATAANPAPTDLAVLWGRIARIELRLDSGEATLQAIDAAAAARRAAQALDNGEYHPSMANLGIARVDLEFRAASLTLLERFDEAIRCCEQILQGSPDEPVGAAHLLTVRTRLGRIAYTRGWYDEAIAQANLGLLMVSKNAPLLVGRLLTSRAAARAALEDNAGALRDCEDAKRLYQEPYGVAVIAGIRAQIGLQSGDAITAEKESRLALRYFPDNLQSRYWHARALVALNRPEGATALRDLATRYPNEHWGRRAARD